MNVNTLKIQRYLNKGSTLASDMGIHINIPKNNLERKHYLGMSTLGSCSRELWIGYHAPQYWGSFDNESNPKMDRIYRLGHIIEAEVLYYLELGGATLSHLQYEITDFNKRLRGHCDAVIDNEFLVEIKGLNDDYSNLLSSLGLKKSFLNYYIQMQLYIHYLKLKGGYMIDYNKNRSEFVVEYIDYEPEIAQKYINKAGNILNSNHINQVTNFEYDIDGDCKWCSALSLCNQL